MITVVDYGGNIASILNMLDHIGVDAQASRDADVLRRAEKLILPGVGAFDNAMVAIRSLDLVGPLEEAVLERKTPVLGVCLGMQLLAAASEEGALPGLGWLDAKVLRIDPPAGSDLKVPNIGWRNIRAERPTALFAPDGPTEKFYFVHSYHVRCADPKDVAATIDYGSPLCCAVARGNIFGVQFHPEKSHRHGMRVLSAFAKAA